jgi:hypothetical protein
MRCERGQFVAQLRSEFIIVRRRLMADRAASHLQIGAYQAGRTQMTKREADILRAQVALIDWRGNGCPEIFRRCVGKPRSGGISALSARLAPKAKL